MVALASCELAAPPVLPAPARPGCVDAAADAAKRASSSVKPAKWQLDLDGDGVVDPAFTSYCSMMGGNCETFLYASNRGCTHFVGQVQETEVASGPRCADAPQGGKPCRLTTSRMMIHGEIYEYFYTYAEATGYVEAGVGDRGPAPPNDED